MKLTMWKLKWTKLLHLRAKLWTSPLYAAREWMERDRREMARKVELPQRRCLGYSYLAFDLTIHRLEYPIGGYNPCAAIPGIAKYLRRTRLVEEVEEDTPASEGGQQRGMQLVLAFPEGEFPDSTIAESKPDEHRQLLRRAPKFCSNLVLLSQSDKRQKLVIKMADYTDLGIVSPEWTAIEEGHPEFFKPPPADWRFATD